MNRKRILSILLILLLITSLAVSAFAEGGNGDGSGGGKNVPLGLAESSVPDGSTNVPTDVTITLTFNKNVVNFTVKDNNMTCFSLADSRGTNVPVTVLMGSRGYQQNYEDWKRKRFLCDLQSPDMVIGELQRLHRLSRYARDGGVQRLK